MITLKKGEYIGHEVYFPDGAPQWIIEILKNSGFPQSQDGFYIPRETIELFKFLASPFKVDILQDNIILGGLSQEKTIDELLDMINRLKTAGVQGVDKYIQKIKDNE